MASRTRNAEAHGRRAAAPEAASVETVRRAIARVRAFFEREIAAAASGDIRTLEELASERGACDEELGAIAAQIGLLGESLPGGVAELDELLGRDLGELTEEARRSHAVLARLRHRVVEAARLLRVVRRAARTYGARPVSPGALLDREG